METDESLQAIQTVHDGSKPRKRTWDGGETQVWRFLQASVRYRIEAIKKEGSFFFEPHLNPIVGRRRMVLIHTPTIKLKKKKRARRTRERELSPG